jgi:hypothetical protein
VVKIQNPTFGVHMNRGEDAPDSFYLGNDEVIWNWILDSAEQGVGWDSLEEEPTRDLIQLNLPDGYYYWNGIFFDLSKELPRGLRDISEARRTVTVTTAHLLDDKAYIATMGLEEVTPEEFYNADLPPNRIISANG